MKRKRLILLSCIIVLVLIIPGTNSVYGQEQVIERKQKYPVSVSLNNHVWSFPFSKIYNGAPLHLGATVGTEYLYKKGKRFQIHQTLNLGYFHNSVTGSAIYTHSDFAFRYTTKYGLMMDMSLGLGYLHGFYPSVIYRQTPSGEYEKKTDMGIPSLMGNMNLEIGYDLSEVSDVDMLFFFRYQWMFSSPYWSRFGMRPSTLFHIGIQKSIFKR